MNKSFRRTTGRDRLTLSTLHQAKPRTLVVAATVIAVTGMTTAHQAPSSALAVTAIAQGGASTAGLPDRVSEQRLNCSGEGYTATYSAQTKYLPPRVDVTFRGKGPTSAV